MMVSRAHPSAPDMLIRNKRISIKQISDDVGAFYREIRGGFAV